jgi:hypothetical protein
MFYQSEARLAPINDLEPFRAAVQPNHCVLTCHDRSRVTRLRHRLERGCADLLNHRKVLTTEFS